MRYRCNIFKDDKAVMLSLKLMETTDIFIEASKGPAFARRGITDEGFMGA